MDEALLKQAGFADAQAYAKWGALHRRHVLGEPMSEAEAAEYEAGCQKIDATVRYDGDAARQQEILDRLDVVEERQRRLTELETAMDARLAALKSELAEAMPQQSTGGN